MASSNLSLFPPSSTNVPRRITSRRGRSNKNSIVNGESNLKGVAFQVVPSSRNLPKAEPTSEPIQHSFFCDPLPSELINQIPGTRPEQDVAVNQDSSSPAGDQLAPLPQSAHLTPKSRPKRNVTPSSNEPKPPSSISIITPRGNTNTPVSEKGDNLSPLPGRTHIIHSSPSAPSGFPSPLRSGSPVPSQNSCRGRSSPMRSIFPVYDPLKPLDRQSYYPPGHTAPTPVCRSDRSDYTSCPATNSVVKRYVSGDSPVEGYENVPVAGRSDSVALWRASREQEASNGRKTQFGLYQPPGKGQSLAIGASPEDFVYVLERGHAETPMHNGTTPTHFAITKKCPTAPMSVPVAQLTLPVVKGRGPAKEIMSIFPEAAAERRSQSDMGSTAENKSTRPSADVVAEAFQQYSCDLIQRNRRCDSLGSVTALYDLIHPSLGTLAVTVTKSQTKTSTTGPRAKISIHHPSASLVAVEAETLVLAVIDFAHSTCVLDLPGLQALRQPHLVDTVICALLGVAVIENDVLMTESTTFDPPPLAPLPNKKNFSPISKTSTWSSTSSKPLQKSRRKLQNITRRNEVREILEEQEDEPEPDNYADSERQRRTADVGFNTNTDELGGLAKGTLKAVGLAFKLGAWAILSGVKVGLWGVEKGIQMAKKNRR